MDKVIIFIYFFSLPVLLGLICPTLAPGGAFLLAILDLILLPLPEPNGWSIAFIFTALVLGHNLFLTFILNLFLPAVIKGLSFLPSPLITPIVALQSPLKSIICLLGINTLTFSNSL